MGMVAIRGVAAAIVVGLTAAQAVAQDKPAAPPPVEAVKLETGEPSAPKPEIHPFEAIAGSWSGGGTISLSGGSRERLRCRAHHTASHANKNLTISIRCASDSHKFDLTSSVVDRRGQIFGRWSESSNGLSGSISGRAAGNRISAMARSDHFSAGLAITTHGNRQTVSITPQGVFITGIYVSLTRR